VRSRWGEVERRLGVEGVRRGVSAWQNPSSYALTTKPQDTVAAAMATANLVFCKTPI